MPFRTIVTTDTYTDAGTLTLAHPIENMTLTVLNASILAQFRLVPVGNYNIAAGDWLPDEREMIPGVWNWRPADFGGGSSGQLVGVRVRSQITGTPARVTINA